MVVAENILILENKLQFIVSSRSGSRSFSKAGKKGGWISKLIFRALPNHYGDPILTKFSSQANF